MHCLDLFNQFDMTIHYIPGKSNVVTNAMSCHLDLSIVVRSVESGLLTWIGEA